MSRRELHSRPWRGRLVGLLVVALLPSGLLLSTGSIADPLSSLADPTRPPGAFRKPGPGQVSVANGGTAPDDPADEASRLPRLQTIQHVGASGRGSAMLNDQIHHTGDRLGAWTLLAIESESVVLKGATGIVRLQLMGGHETLKQWRGVSAPTPRKDQP
ncbi:hypothetical protein WNB94_09460 [Aquabacterium sp. A3]|uniref:hypothetical protein n=1 Tax=Aquabacterium sp. A3 TaxID=3132829 RepID=UPI003119CD75